MENQNHMVLEIDKNQTKPQRREIQSCSYSNRATEHKLRSQLRPRHTDVVRNRSHT